MIVLLIPSRLMTSLVRMSHRQLRDLVEFHNDQFAIDELEPADIRDLIIFGRDPDALNARFMNWLRRGAASS
jgi:hypothetical protein